MTLPGPPRGWSEGVGGGMRLAGEEGRGAASSELVSPSSPRREDCVELRDVRPDMINFV